MGMLDVSEKEFAPNALVNAFPDKSKFFGAGYEQENGCWPSEMDRQFRDFPIFRVAPMPANNFALLEEPEKTLLAVSVVKKEGRYTTVKLETNAGNRFVTAKSVHIGSRRVST